MNNITRRTPIFTSKVLLKKWPNTALLKAEMVNHQRTNMNPTVHLEIKQNTYYLMDQANRADLVAGLGLAPEGRVKHGSRHQKKTPV